MLLLVIGPGDVSHEESLHEPGELFEWLLAWIKQDNVRPAKCLLSFLAIRWPE